MSRGGGWGNYFGLDAINLKDPPLLQRCLVRGLYILT